jgi:hypothetical protein
MVKMAYMSSFFFPVNIFQILEICLSDYQLNRFVLNHILFLSNNIILVFDKFRISFDQLLLKICYIN